MDVPAASEERFVSFKSPKRFLADLDPVVTAKVVASAADVALIVDDGVIKDIAFGRGDLSQDGYDKSWRGKRWIETVTVESRPKIEDLLKTRANARPCWRQVNHPSTAGGDIPIKYTAVKTGDKNRIVALGRDLRAVSALQQRLIEAHQGLERDYDRMRDAQNRYQSLFYAISEAVLIVDSQTLKIEDANPAVRDQFDKHKKPVEGELMLDLFPRKQHRAIEKAVDEALVNGAAVSAPVTSNGDTRRLSLSAFRQDDQTYLIVRILSDASRDVPDATEIPGVLEALPDGLVIADADLDILQANRAFHEMARLSGTREAVGRRLGDFLGRSQTDLNVVLSSVRSHGFARNFSTIMRDRFGKEERVEVSAVAAPAGKDEVLGFSIRTVARRLETGARVGEQLPSSVDQLTDLVGKVPLKEIVRESTDLIEKLCIEAALEITDDNRASAAEMLGVSRQGLYSKLKRFDIDD